jgi:acyl-CoA thioester hydrolase
MDEFSLDIQLRWSDLDPNDHIRHSVYYDWGAMCRMQYLGLQGLTIAKMHEVKFGLVLLREECIFRKEIRSDDRIRIDLKLVQAQADYSRWSIQHQITKNGGTHCAFIRVDGAWIDLTRRKMAAPPEEIRQAFVRMPGGPLANS